MSNCGFAGSRFAAKFSPNSQHLQPAGSSSTVFAVNLILGYSISRRYDKLIKETVIEANKDACPITELR